MKINTYKLYSEQEINQLEEKLHELISEWSKHWLTGDLSQIEVSASATDAHSQSPNRNDPSVCFLSGDSGARLAMERKVAGNLLTLLFPQFEQREETSPVEQELIESSLKALIGTVMQQTAVSSDETEQSYRSNTGSGWITAEATIATAQEAHIQFYFELGPAHVRSVLNVKPTSVDALKKGMEGMVPRTQAITEQTLPVRAELGGVEVTIAELDSLAVGDVIKLDKQFGERVALVSEQNEFIVNAVLGASETKRALKLVKQNEAVQGSKS